MFGIPNRLFKKQRGARILIVLPNRLDIYGPPSLQYFKVMKARIDVCWESYEDIGLQYESDYFDWPFDIWPRNYDTIGNEISNLAFEHADITVEQKKQVLNTFFRVRELTFNINKNGEPYIAIVVDCG